LDDDELKLSHGQQTWIAYNMIRLRNMIVIIVFVLMFFLSAKKKLKVRRSSSEFVGGGVKSRNLTMFFKHMSLINLQSYFFEGVTPLKKLVLTLMHSTLFKNIVEKSCFCDVFNYFFRAKA